MAQRYPVLSHLGGLIQRGNSYTGRGVGGGEHPKRPTDSQRQEVLNFLQVRGDAKINNTLIIQ